MTMLGMSAAVLQGLHEMRRPKEEIKFSTVTEAEFRAKSRAQGADETEIDIAVSMMRAGAHLDGGNGWRITLADAPPAA